MPSKRAYGLLAATVILMMFSLSFRPVVQADALLQDVPRLDGMNIYFTEAAGEASRFDRSEVGLSRFAGLLSQLGANLFTLEWRTGFPSDADLIVIAGPKSDFAPDQIARLWSYMNNKGRVLLLADANAGGRGGALRVSSGLFELMWSDMGIRARDDVLVTEGIEPIYATPEPLATAEATAEAVAATAEVLTEAPTPPAIVGQRPILISDFTTTNLNTTSPITTGLESNLAFFTARSLEVDASIQGYQVIPLVFTNEQFYGETDYAQYLSDGTFDFNIGKDTTRSALPVAAAFRNDSTNTRIVIVGDREFATNGAGLQTSPSNSAGFVYPDNARFLLNAVTWLLDQQPVDLAFPSPAPTGTATITPSPTPTRTPTPLPTPTAGAEVTSEPTASS